MMEPMTPDVGGSPLPSSAYERFFHSAPVAMLVLRAADLVMLEANQPYLDAVGMALDDLVGRDVFDVFPNSPTNAGTDQETDLRSLMTAAVTRQAPVTAQGFRYDIPSGDGFDVRWWNVVETPVTQHGEVAYLLHYTEDVTDLHRARAQLTEAQAAREVSATQLTRLAEVALSLTGAETVEDLERIVVTGGLTVLGADGGGIITPTATGDWRVTVSESLGSQVRTSYALQPYDSPLPAPVSARTGEMVLLRNREECVAFHPDMAQVVADTGRTAWACLPLTVQDRTLGVLAAGWRGEQTFGPRILELMEGFAAQCATTLDRLEKAHELRRSSRRFQELAESLQSAMLTEPAAGGGLEVTVRYRTADDVAQVGGDWYDSFMQPDGATMLAIGDVSGHDEVAAAKMGQIRGLLRALAYDAEDRPHGDSPATVLTRLEYVAQGLAVSELSTAILARIEDAEGPGRLLRWSNAGNAPPVVLLPDGSTLLLDDKSDLLLGVDPTFPRRDHEITLAPGSTLLLYTDGLIERRGTAIDVGIEDLRAALSSLAGAPLGALCDTVLETLAPHTGEDDIALIAVRV